MGFERRRTRSDIRFDAHWYNVMSSEYPPLPGDINENWLEGSDNDE